jgi:transcription antitermination factor NusG
MRIGEKVRMTGGPFSGMPGAIVSLHRRRVVLAVILGSREVQIEIERDWIGVLPARRRSTPGIEASNLSQRAAG